MANIGKTPEQDQIFYHLKMAFTIAVNKAKAFCRQVSVSLLPSGIQSGLEKSEQRLQSLHERSISRSESMDSFNLPDLDLIKADFKLAVRHTTDDLWDADTADQRRARHDDIIQLNLHVRDHLADCKTLDDLVRLVDAETPISVKRSLFVALDEIISEAGSESTLSEECKDIITNVVEKDEPFSKEMTGEDLDIPWLVRIDKEEAFKAMRGSFLDYLGLMVNDAKDSPEAADEVNVYADEEEQIDVESVPAELDQVGITMKPHQRQGSIDSGVSSISGSLSRTDSMPDMDALTDDLKEADLRSARSSVSSGYEGSEVDDLEDDVFESPDNVGKLSDTESNWSEPFMNEWNLRDLRLKIEACDSYDDILKLVKENAPTQYRDALLAGLQNDHDKYRPFL